MHKLSDKLCISFYQSRFYQLQNFVWPHQTIINLIHVLYVLCVGFIKCPDSVRVWNTTSQLSTWPNDQMHKVGKRWVAALNPRLRHIFRFWIFPWCPFHISRRSIPMKSSMTFIQSNGCLLKDIFNFSEYSGGIYDGTSALRLYVRRKSDLPLYIAQIHAFYFDTTPCILNDNVNTKSVWLNNLLDVCLQYCIETTWTMFQTVL